MKPLGIIVGCVGAALFVWHLAKVLAGTDQGQGPLTHHSTSLVGGVVMFVGVWLYVVGRRRARQGISPRSITCAN